MMDNHKICFIICTNNLMYCDECIYYISHLNVPNGFFIDVLTVTEAKSMTSGYNEAMGMSDAKYKVYLHQDTFIINLNFISDILFIFQNNLSIGMIGMVGSMELDKDGIMWNVNRYGKLYETHVHETVLLESEFEQDIAEVMVVDGFLMVTQYDIFWRQDLFTKWDFYDCSQSMEFRKAGYKVTVPRQQSPWSLHDCGFVNLENYEEERIKFINEYM